MTPAGAVTILYNFYGTNAGDSNGGLVQGSDGNLYGTTSYSFGGGCALTVACGTVFKITPSGVFTRLHSFDFTDGSLPNGLVQGSDGDLYGTTTNGGSSNSPNCSSGPGGIECGTIFKITPGGAFTTLHSFNHDDGYEPYAGLVQATDGNFYGTTFGGGTNGWGTIFEITPAGVLTTLYSFAASSGLSGYGPQTALVQDTNGDFYGTTQLGGSSAACNVGYNTGCGTVFRLSVGLDPFVKTLPAVGPVGSTVRILGTDLTGATSVTFNGTPAAFIVVRPSEILTKVPAGATPGRVQVITPSGTLKSNVGFFVP